MSINDEDCEYYQIMRQKLNSWIKEVYINVYNVPDDFYNINVEPQCVKQLINGKWVPRNILSMFYNYKNAFEMACKYEKLNNIEYDYYMTFRTDIIIDKLPLFECPNKNELLLYSINPPCYFISFGKYKVDIVSNEWVYGNKQSMAIYCETYDYILETNKLDNNYIIHFESNCTDNCISKNLQIKRLENIPYYVDKNRRMFDKNWEKDEHGNVSDSRIYDIANKTIDYIDIKTIKKNIHIEQSPQN
jgi:hypothetical protein